MTTSNLKILAASEQGTTVQTSGARITRGQIPCPDCSEPIVLPFAALMTGQRVYCSHCGVSLATRVEDSAEALAALRKAKRLIESLGAPGQGGQP